MAHLKKPQFIAHMQFVQGMSKAEAEVRWNRDIDKPAIKRNGSGPDIEVPVVLPRVTEGIRSKTATASLSVTCCQRVLFGQCHQAFEIQCYGSEPD